MGPPMVASRRSDRAIGAPVVVSRTTVRTVQDVGRLLLVFGVLLAVIGGGLMLFGRFHLPGDFTFRSGNVTVYLPIATSIILSIVLTVVVNLFFRQR